MRTLPISVIALTFFCAAGCNNAKSPESVAKDVAAAQQKASTEVAETQKDASQDIGKAADKVDDKLADLNNTVASNAYDIALTKAEGERKIALAKCDALGGDAQKSCKDQADADFAAVKANAKAAEVANKQ